MDIRRVAVIGLGTMGAGIAEVFARAGLDVVAIEADEAALARGMSILDASLAKALSRGKLTEAERELIARRVQPAGGLDGAAGADLVIEVVPERLDIKRQIFAELDRVCRPEAILATNTSSLSVTAIAAGTAHPGRVAGLHFFNPAPVMRLVEVVTTVLTNDGVATALTGLARQLGKSPVRVGDRAGFVANALLLPYLNHAVTLLDTGYASREDIDTAATAGLGLPMGPLALLDLIGLDTSLSILEVLRAEFASTRYGPAPLLRRLVAAGRLGRKTGGGLYDYPKLEPASGQALPEPPAVITVPGSGQERDTLAAALGEAGRTVVADPAAPSDLVVVAASPDTPVLPVALAVGRPADAVGLHLPPALKDDTAPGAAKAGAASPDGTAAGLAEIVTTPLTTPAALAAARALAECLGLTAVCAPDRPGFLVGTLLYTHVADAVRMVQDGYASAADVDTAMTLGCGYPRGPLQLLDAAGLPAAVTVLRAMHRAYGDPAFAVPPMLADYATAGLRFAAARS